MNKSFKITVAKPCHENWATMTPTQKGKHCGLCEKEVIDFTKATDEQLYKTATSGGNLCGRFTKSQLDRPIQLQRKEGRSWASYAASLLIPATMLATQEITAQSEIQRLEQTNNGYQSLGVSSLTRLKDGTLSRKHTKNDTLKKSVTRMIKGVIAKENGPLPGASIIIKGTNIGTQTDFDGSYELEVSEGDTLLISCVGYTSKEINIKEQEIIDVVLAHKIEILGEIIVGMINYKYDKEREK